MGAISEDSEAFSNFKELEFFKTIQEYFTAITDENETDLRVKVLVDEIKEIHYEKLHGRIDELRKTTTDFLGKFSDNNILKFKKQLTDDKSFLAFSQNLTDFVEDKKLIGLRKKSMNDFP